MTAAFSFSPSRGFVNVNSVAVTVIYELGSIGQAPKFAIQLNQQSTANAPLPTVLGSTPQIVVVPTNSQDVHVGSNLIEIGVVPMFNTLTISEVRLTVEYTFLA